MHQKINADSFVIREQRVAINCHEIQVERDVDYVMIDVHWQSPNGRPRRKTIRIPADELRGDETRGLL